MRRNSIGHWLATMTPRQKLAVMIGGDALFLPLCVLASVAFRLGSLEAAWSVSPWTQLSLGLLTLPILGVAGLYRTVVRYIDLRVIAAASGALAIVVLLVFGLALVLGVRVIPRSSLLIYWFVAFTYVITSRFIARQLLRRGLKRPDRPRLNTAIYGAGDAGAQLAQAMQFSTEYKAACFLDDRGDLHGKTVAGLRVYAPADLPRATARHELTQVVLAMPSINTSRRRAIISSLESANLPVKMLPGLADIVDGHADVSDIREIDVADLLGRDPVPPQADLFARNIHDKVVLVTGAGGSIGSELCRQIVSQKPSRLILLDHSEFALYSIDQELRQVEGTLQIVPCLGSVLDEDLLQRTLAENGVQTIYHAAAYKHVPLVESNVRQGLLNNVVGAQVLVRAALAARVETCVLISTDKAVRPTNVMGASKRAAELIFQAANQRTHGTRFSMVRFGNVLGSSGSVVPLFKKQIQAGGPITITHPEIIRYFMLIPEAAQLVIQAGAMAQGGEVFVLDMGEPVRIADLARSMIRLSGLEERTAEEPEGDIEIKFVGLRPGEKLFEELLIGDTVVPSDHPRIMCARERYIDALLLDKMIDALRAACELDDHAGMIRQIQNLVPEYRSADEVNQSALAAAPAR